MADYADFADYSGGKPPHYHLRHRIKIRCPAFWVNWLPRSAKAQAVPSGKPMSLSISEPPRKGATSWLITLIAQMTAGAAEGSVKSSFSTPE